MRASGTRTHDLKVRNDFSRQLWMWWRESCMVRLNKEGAIFDVKCGRICWNQLSSSCYSLRLTHVPMLDFNVIIFELSDVKIFRYHATTIAASKQQQQLPNFAFLRKKSSARRLQNCWLWLCIACLRSRCVDIFFLLRFLHFRLLSTLKAKKVFTYNQNDPSRFSIRNFLMHQKTL